MCIARGLTNFEFPRWPSEFAAHQCRPIGPGWQIGRHSLAGISEAIVESDFFCQIWQSTIKYDIIKARIERSHFLSFKIQVTHSGTLINCLQVNGYFIIINL